MSIDKAVETSVGVRPTTGVSSPKKDVQVRLRSEAELLKLRLQAVGDESYTPLAAKERLEGLGLVQGSWGEVQDRLSHELRALVRIARGKKPRFLRDVIPQVNVEQKVGKDRLMYSEQPIIEGSSFDGWERYVGAEFEILTRGVFFRDKTFIWTQDTGHSAMTLAGNKEDVAPSIDVTVMSRHPLPEETSVGFRVFPNTTDQEVDLLASYFQRSMLNSPKVKFSVSYPQPSGKEFFSGSFDEYFKTREE